MNTRTNPSPVISVIMPVYNAKEFLSEAINSILDQTFSNLEFIIIDDYSSDGSSEIINKFANQDDRIVSIKNNINLGVTKSLNKGINLSRGKYIARMDADDISFPDRFSIQIEYLESHPETGVLGTGLFYINESGQITGRSIMPNSTDLIRWLLLFDSCLIHPSVLIRSDLLKSNGGYNESIIFAQDYDLWTRLICHSEIKNLDCCLVKCRQGEKRISALHKTEQNLTANLIASSYWKNYLQIEISQEQISFLKKPFSNQSEIANECASKLFLVYTKFLQKNKPSEETIQIIKSRVVEKLLSILFLYKNNLWIIKFIIVLPFIDVELVTRFFSYLSGKWRNAIIE